VKKTAVIFLAMIKSQCYKIFKDLIALCLPLKLESRHMSQIKLSNIWCYCMLPYGSLPFGILPSNM